MEGPALLTLRRARTDPALEPDQPVVDTHGFTSRDGLLFITGLGFFVLSSGFSQISLAFPAAGWLSALSAFGAVTLLLLALARRRLVPRFETYVFVGALCLVGLFSYMGASVGPPNPSDEVGIAAAAANALAHGHNPYTVDYAADPAIAGEQSSWYTPTFTGKPVLEYAYPAGTFLALTPFALLFGTGGLTHLYPFVFLLSIVLAWLVVPRRVRPFMTIVLLLMMASGTLTGSTDPLYMPFLVLAVWRWPRFVRPDASWAGRLMGPLALGIACAMKQNAWIVAPFLLVGVCMEARVHGRRWLPVAARYVALALTAFVLVNAPFIVADPRAWAHGVLLPLTLHTFLIGNGIAAIPLASASGADHVELLSVASALALVATLLFAVARYRLARRVLPLLPLIPLLMSTRSLSGYLFFLLVPAIVAATTLDEPGARPLPVRWARLSWRAAMVAAALTAAVAGFVLAQSAPMTLSVVSSQVSGGRWESVTVRVSNHSTRAINPSFLAARNEVGQFSLTRIDGPATIASGTSALYRLGSLPRDSTLHPGDTVRILAVSDQPESISTSDLYSVVGQPTP